VIFPDALAHYAFGTEIDKADWPSKAAGNGEARGFDPRNRFHAFHELPVKEHLIFLVSHKRLMED